MRIPSRLDVVLAVTAVAVAVAATLSTSGESEPRDAGGPLRGAPPHGFAVTVPVGATFTDGFETLLVRGDRPVVLESVELVGADGLKVVGFQVAGPERRETIQYLPGFPPVDASGVLDPRLVVPGEGAVLQPPEPAG